MLAIPEFGFRLSVKQHNCDLMVVCDWIEASLLADEVEIADTKVADILHEQGFYPGSSDNHSLLGAEFMEMVLMEMRRRESLMGRAASFQVEGKRILRRSTWQEFAPSTFLLMLACADYFSALRAKPFNNYVEQGALFEDFCVFSLCGGGWQTSRTGWSSHKGAKKLPSTVAAVADALEERAINNAVVKRHRNRNEAGCDLVSHWPYPDGLTGRPVVLLQCASGADFTEKLGTPSIDLWTKLIAFSTIPLRGFCTPKAFAREIFQQHSDEVSGVFLDRFRLLQSFAQAQTLLPDALKGRIATWLKLRVCAMPRLV